MSGRWHLGFLLVFFWATAARAEDPSLVEQGLLMSGLLGTITVDGVQWQRLDLQPHFRSGAFEAVLDLELFLDEEGRFQNRGWDFSSRRKGLESLLRKVHTVRYGETGDKSRRLYLRVGDLDGVTLGQGMIMRRYRNTLDAPGVKRTGLDLQVRGLGGDRVKLRGVISSLLDLDGGGPVVGGRAVFLPSGRLEVGGTVVVDTDQLSGLPDSVRSGLGKDPYGVAGIDVVYPLSSGPSVQAALYGGISRTLKGEGGGTGLSGPGVRVVAGGLTLQGEYRWVEGRFTPAHFDALYELTRAAIDPATNRAVTREALLADVSMRGVFGDVGLSLGPLLQAQASYQYLSGGGADEQRLEGRASLGSGLLQQLHKVQMVEAYFEKRHFGSGGGGFFDATPETRFGYRLGLEPIARLSVIWEVEFTYEPDGTGGFQRRRLFNLQSRIGL